jgi:nitroreductase
MRNWDAIFGKPNPAAYTRRPVAGSDLQHILRATFQSDTDLIAHPWELVVITDPIRVRAVGDAATNSELLKSAPVLVAIGIDKQKARKALLDFNNRLADGSPAFAHYQRYKTAVNDDLVFQEWLATAAARCSMRLTLAAKALGYPATVFDVLSSEKIRLLLSAPPEVEIRLLVSIGEPIAQRNFDTQPSSPERVIFSDYWGHQFSLRETEQRVSYRDSLISYFDVLGFKNMVADWPPDRIGVALAELLSLSSHDLHLIRMTSRGLSTFSDHVVRTVGLDGLNENQILDVIEFELAQLQHIQANLAAQNVFVRGAITRGPIFIDQDLVFGPALIRAYELEQTLALHPRVIFDPSLLEHLARDGNLADRLSLLCSHFLFQATDGLSSIDYLQVGDHVAERLDLLNIHAQIVGKALSEITAPAVAAKYHWLAEYHNKIVADLSDADFDESGPERSDLLIRL